MVSQSALPRRTLGRTGLEASILGFGTAPLGDLFLELDDQTAIAAASRAFEVPDGHTPGLRRQRDGVLRPRA